MYHIFLIHSLMDGHLGCFQVLVMTTNAAMNIVEHMSLCLDWASFGYTPKSVIARSSGRLFPNFLRNSKLISKGAVPSCTLTSNGGVFLVPYNLSSISCLQCFDLGHSNKCKMESQSCFDLHFSDDCWPMFLSHTVLQSFSAKETCRSLH